MQRKQGLEVGADGDKNRDAKEEGGWKETRRTYVERL